jgi:hypothetical protein
MRRSRSGRVLPPLNEILRVSTSGLADIDLAEIYSGGKGQPCLLHAECGENLGPEKHEISDGKRCHHETKAPCQHVADGRTALRSARLFCSLDDLAVFLFSHFLFSHVSSLHVRPSRHIAPREQRVMLGDVPKPSAGRIILSPAHILADHALGASHALVASGLLVGILARARKPSPT